MNGGSKEGEDGSSDVESLKPPSIFSNPWVIVAIAFAALLLVLGLSLLFLRRHIAAKEAQRRHLEAPLNASQSGSAFRAHRSGQYREGAVQRPVSSAAAGGAVGGTSNYASASSPSGPWDAEQAAERLEMVFVWLGVAVGALALPVSLILAFYYGFKTVCLAPRYRDWHAETETFVGSLPALSRTAVLGPVLSWVAVTLIKSATGFSDWPAWCPFGKREVPDGDDLSPELVAELSEELLQKVREDREAAVLRERAKHRSLLMILLLGQGVNASKAPRKEVDWDRIAGQNADFPQAFIQDLPDDQQLTSWKEACKALGLTDLQARCIGLVKLLFWHWSQPVVYTWVFYNYFCKH